MANTYVLLASSTLGSNQASVTFSSIPQSYTDLVCHFSARSSVASTVDTLLVSLNGNSSSIYSQTHIRSTGSSVGSSGSRAISSFQLDWGLNGDTSRSSSFGNGELVIPNYTVAVNKQLYSTIVQVNQSSIEYVRLWSLSYLSTSAISSITFQAQGGNLMAGSSFYLYGIKNS